jgi:hypothetical protein
MKGDDSFAHMVGWFMVLKATYISVMSWWSVLLVEETGVRKKNTDMLQVTDKLFIT